MVSTQILDHLSPHWTTVRSDLLEKAGSLIKMKVEAAQVRHAELLFEYHKLKEEAAAADNRHAKAHLDGLIEHIMPQIQLAYDTIRPFIRK
jgi:hypothetical protein